MDPLQVAVPQIAARPVVFLSDFGLDDEFVGIVHCVIASEAPGVRVVDLNHRIRPYDVRAGSLALWRASPWLEGCVVLGVVDPGVGTPRRALAMEVAGAGVSLVGPDNGLLIPVAHALGGVTAAVELRPLRPARRGLGATFDGRDLFAPVAARLASRQWSLADAGVAVDPSSLCGEGVRMAVEGGTEAGSPGGGGDVMVCEVLWVDRFGNAQLNTRGEDLGDTVRVATAGQSVEARRVSAFGSLAGGELGLVKDSYGLLALALDGAPAASLLGLREGDVVRLSSTHAGPQRR